MQSEVRGQWPGILEVGRIRPTTGDQEVGRPLGRTVDSSSEERVRTVKGG
jgi:hypothetical protein